MSKVLLTTVSASPVQPQEVLLLRHLVGLAALGRAPSRPWHLEAVPAAVAQCSAGEGGRCSAVAACSSVDLRLWALSRSPLSSSCRGRGRGKKQGPLATSVRSPGWRFGAWARAPDLLLLVKLLV
jgi:hypothetical protein